MLLEKNCPDADWSKDWENNWLEALKETWNEFIKGFDYLGKNCRHERDDVDWQVDA